MNLTEEIDKNAYLRQVEHLELKIRFLLDSIFKGIHRSRKKGASVEFLDYKEYSTFDDINQIDWKLYGRRDKLFVRQREDEARLECYLLLDKSSSMNYASAAYSKFEYAKILTSILSHLILKNYDIAELKFFDEKSDYFLSKGRGQEYFFQILEYLGNLSTSGGTDLFKGIEAIKDSLKKKSLIFILSDFLFNLENPEKTLSAVSALNQFDSLVVLLHIIDPEEYHFPFSGRYLFKDPETGKTLDLNSADIRKTYLRLVSDYMEKLKRGSAGNNLYYQTVLTASEFPMILSRLLELLYE